MKKITICVVSIIILLFAATIYMSLHGAAYRQEGIAGGWGNKNIPVTKLSNIKKSVVHKLSERQNDTVYCLATTKKYQWQIPKQIISEKEAKEMPFVIRLTNKSKGGYYCSLEILRRGLRPSNSGVTMTISGLLPDSVVNSSEIIQLWSSIQRLNIIPDYTGTQVLQERYYNANNQLLGYIVHQPANDSIHDTEYYFGSNGLPVNIDKTGTYSGGVHLNTVFDCQGNDSILYLTHEGEVVPNKDGAYYLQHVMSTNANGETVKITRSLDEKYTPIIDKFGNCGGITILDRNHNDSIQTYIDTFDCPIAIPESSYDKTRVNVSSVKIHYDSRLRIDTMKYFGVRGEPVNNILGTHKIVIEYDSLSNESSRSGYDIEGKLSPMDVQGVAMYTVIWDSLANVIEYHQYDKNLAPISYEGSNSSFYNTYDSITKRLVRSEGFNYNKETGKEEIAYKSVYSKTLDSFVYSDKTSKIERYDSLGRSVCIRFYDSMGNPDSTAYCAIDSTEFIKEDSVNKSINREYRANGMIKSESIYDSISHINTYFGYDEIGNKTDTYIHRYGKDGDFIGQSDCSELGNPCRAGGNSGVRFLHADVSRTLDKSFNVFRIIDEFNEPDYLVGSDGEIYSSFGENEQRYNSRILRDEYGREIKNQNALRDSLAKVMSIEIVDSTAISNLGLKDNDVILQYGNYKPSLKNPLSEDDFKKQWAVRSILDANEYKTMVVFRIEDAPTGQYGLRPISIPPGTPSELGFIPHIRFLTDRQRARILQSMSEADFELPDSTTLPLEGHLAVIGYSEMYRNMRNLPYQSKIKDASILLGAIDKEYGQSWTGSDGSDLNELSEIVDMTVKNYGSDLSQPQYYFTRDGINIIPLYNCGKLYDCYISDSDYSKLQSLYSQIEDIRLRSHEEYKPLDKMQLAGQWIISSNDSIDNKGYLYFEKNGKMIGEITTFSVVPSEKTIEKDGSPRFKITSQINGNYRTGETRLKFVQDDDSNTEYECIGVVDATMDVDSLKNYFTTDVAKYPTWYKNRMEYTLDIENEALVKSIDKKNLILADRFGNEVRFTKAKGKPKFQPKEKLNPSQLIGTWVATEPNAKAVLELLPGGSMNFSVCAVNFDSDVAEVGSIAVGAIFKGNWKIAKDDLILRLDTDSVDLQIQTIKREETYMDLDGIADMYRTQFLKNMEENFPADAPLGKFVSLKQDKLNFRDLSLMKAPEEKVCMLGTVEDEQGYLAKQGLSGTFVVLKWCDWDCTKTIDEFGLEFEKMKQSPKDIVLLPLSADGNGNDVFGNPLSLSVPEDYLGLHLKTVSVNYAYYLKQVETRMQMLETSYKME